jgi:RNA polymerase sigma factor (sigma-70 family)
MMETYRIEDHKLLRRYACGDDQRAFDILVRRYYSLVHRAALSKTGNAHLADDVTNTVFLLLAQRSRSIAPEVVIAGWLFNAAYLTACNALRIERRRQMRENSALSMDRHYEGPHADERFEAISDALYKLNSRDREAVLLRYAQGLSVSETAETLGISSPAAAKRASRGLDRLRRHCVGVAPSETVTNGDSIMPASTYNRMEIDQMQSVLDYGTPREFAVTFFQCLAGGDVDGAFHMIQGVGRCAYPQVMVDEVRKDLEELKFVKVLNVGEPYICHDNIHRWRIPFNIEVAGARKTYKIAVRNDNPESRWEVGGWGEEHPIDEEKDIFSQERDWPALAQSSPAYSSPREMAIAYFTHYRNGEIDKAYAMESAAMSGWIPDRDERQWQQYLSGLSFRITGETIAFEWNPAARGVPYELTLRDGTTRKGFLFVRNDNQWNKWVMDGGL